MRRRSRHTLPATWSVATGTHDGMPIIVRVDRIWMHDVTSRASMPIRAGVTVPFRRELRGREVARFHHIEDSIDDAFIGVGRLVAVITAPQFRKFVLHASTEATAEWIAQRHTQLQQRFRRFEIQMFAETDPDWALYDALTQRVPPGG